MNRIKKNFNLLVFLILLLSGCTFSESGSLPAQETEIKKEAEIKAGKETAAERKTETQTAAETEKTGTAAGNLPRILLIYMVGSDLESEYGSASADIGELLLGTGAEGNGSIYLCTGGTEFWWRPEIPADECTVFKVENGTLERLASVSGANMADPETLTWFIDTVHSDPETAELSLIFWNHGGGATAGCGADANFDFDLMSVPEFHRGLESSGYIRNGGRFSLIGFDACLMGMLEVADSLKDCADCMIASEETISGCGWDYSVIADLYCSGSSAGTEAAKVIAEAYRNSVEKNSPYAAEYTISVLDLTGTAQVTDALGQMMEVLQRDFTRETFSSLSRIRRETRSFGNRGTVYDSMDLADFAERTRSLYADESDRLKKSLDEFVILNLTNISGAGGVAVYFPFDSKEKAEERLEQYSLLEFCPAYTAFIGEFQSVLNGSALARWNITDTVPRLDRRTLTMTLDEDQAENFSSADCMIWEDLHENGEYRCWFRGGSATLSEGVLTGQIENQIFVIQDEDNEEYAPCMVMETERTETSVSYKTWLSVIRIPEVSEPEGDSIREKTQYAVLAGQWEFYTVEVYFTVSGAEPEGVITGMYVTNASKAGVQDFLPPKYDFVLQEGDIVQCFQLCRRITYESDGSVKPFSEWENMGTYRGFDFTASGQGIRISTMDFDQEADYCCVFQITDLQQNSYMSDLVSLKNEIE